MRARLRDAVADAARAHSAPRSVDAAPLRTPVPVPLVERLALAVGIVAYGIQASGVLARVVWSALSLGR